MYNNAYIVSHQQSQLALGEEVAELQVTGEEPAQVETKTTGGDAESTDIPTAPSGGDAEISDDKQYKDKFANLMDYAVNYGNRELYTEGCIVESRTYNPTVVKSWKVVGMKGKSTCVLMSVNNITYRHGKYKMTNPPGNPVEMDIGYLKFMLSKTSQEDSEAGTALHKKDPKSRWFRDELETNPYIL